MAWVGIAILGTPEADAYLDDMALGANFATVNHLLINALDQKTVDDEFVASEVARLKARFVIKDAHMSLRGAA